MKVARIKSSLMKETVAEVRMFFLLRFPYSCFVLLNTFHKRKGVISLVLDIFHLLGDGPGLVLVSPSIFPACSAEISWFYWTSFITIPFFLPCRFCYLQINHRSPFACLLLYITFMLRCVRKCLLLVLLLVVLTYQKRSMYCHIF